MKPRQVESLLKGYPYLWQSYRTQQDEILYSGKSSSAWTSIYYGGSGTYSDKTASKAIKLADLSHTERILLSIRKWLDVSTKPSYRAILINRWRGYSWRHIARRLRQTVQEVVMLWGQMVLELTAAILSAGHV